MHCKKVRIMLILFLVNMCMLHQILLRKKQEGKGNELYYVLDIGTFPNCSVSLVGIKYINNEDCI